MRWLVSSSLKFRYVVVTLAVAILALGVVQLRNAPVDTYPQFTPTTVQVQTEALGLSAEEVEQFITVPLEQDLLNGVAWLDRITSESMPGLSSIDLTFEPGTNMLHARQVVQERLTQAHALPNVGSPPVMVQPLSSASRVMMISLSSKDVSLIDMSVLARWKIKPRLMAVPGVANISIFGQRDRQLQVQVDPEKLRKYGVSLSQVVDTTGNALWVSPLTFVEASTPGTGGFIDTPQQRMSIQHMLPITSPKSLSAVAIEDTQGRVIRLGDVANVVENHQPFMIGDAVLKSGPSLILLVQKFPGVSTLEVTKGIQEAMRTMAPGLSGITVDTTTYRSASFVKTALHNLGRTSLIALLLVLVLLNLLFFSWRVALISFVTIPLTVVAAAYVLYLRGVTLNSMLVAGVAVAMAVIIDDAVVGVDNVRRRLREHRAAESDRSTLQVVTEATLETGGPLMFATLAILLAAVPIALVKGTGGAFSRPLMATYALAVLVSFLVAATVTPALSSLLLRNQALTRRELGWLRPAGRLYGKGLRSYLYGPRWVYGTVAVLALSGIAVGAQIGSHQVLPSLKDRDVLVHWQATPSMSLPEMDRLTTAVSNELRSLPGVRAVAAEVGRAVLADQIVNVNSGELWVTIAPSAPYKSTVDAIKRVTSSYPGLSSKVTTYTDDRIRETEAGPGKALVVRVYGPDLAKLPATADQVLGAVRGVKGVHNAKVQAEPTQPTVQVEVNLDAARKYGIKPGDVRRIATTLVSGLPAGNLYENQAVFDVVVWGTPSIRNSPLALRNLLIDTPSGKRVRLGDLASVDVRPNLAAIHHDATSRYVQITADVNGRALSDVVGDVDKALKAQTMPLEYHAEVLRDTTRHESDNLRLLGYAVAAGIGIFLLLQAAFRSWRLGGVFFLALPLAGTGVVLTAPLVGGLMTLGALLAVMTVVGLAIRHAVVLVRHYQQLEEDGQPFGVHLVQQGTRDRALPVVLSTLTLAVAVSPFAFSGSIAGLEVLHPFAVTVLGGLVTSTLVTLFVVPALYLRAAPGARAERARPQPDTKPVSV